MNDYSKMLFYCILLIFAIYLTYIILNELYLSTDSRYNRLDVSY